MDAKLKAKWVKALRSGRYKQGRGALRRGDTYCCLGVLCKIQRADFNALKTKSTDIFPYEGGTNWKTRVRLAEMNDGCGVPRRSFSEIADYIEANL